MSQLARWWWIVPICAAVVALAAVSLSSHKLTDPRAVARVHAQDTTVSYQFSGEPQPFTAARTVNDLSETDFIDPQIKGADTRSNGALEMQFFGKTLIPQELEIMNAVKSGSIAMGSPRGRRDDISGDGRVPRALSGQGLHAAYDMFNGKIGDKLDKQIEDNYKLKVLCYFDYGFRHFWTSKKPIVEPKTCAASRSACSAKDFRRHHQWAWRQRRADGLWRVVTAANRA